MHPAPPLYRYWPHILKTIGSYGTRVMRSPSGHEMLTDIGRYLDAGGGDAGGGDAGGGAARDGAVAHPAEAIRSSGDQPGDAESETES